MILRAAMVVWLVGAGFFFVFLKPVLGQNQDILNERNRAAIETLGTELERLREANLIARIAILEEAQVEARWIGRTISTVLIGQLALGLWERKKSR